MQYEVRGLSVFLFLQGLAAGRALQHKWRCSAIFLAKRASESLVSSVCRAKFDAKFCIVQGNAVEEVLSKFSESAIVIPSCTPTPKETDPPELFFAFFGPRMAQFTDAFCAPFWPFFGPPRPQKR